MSLFLRRTAAFAFSLLLISCGGGGGGTDSTADGKGSQSPDGQAPSDGAGGGSVPPPSDTQAGRAAKCAERGLPHTDINDSEPVVCIGATPVSPPLDYEQCIANGHQFDTGYNNPFDGLPVLRNGERINKFYCTPPAINGTVNPGCLCVDAG